MGNGTAGESSLRRWQLAAVAATTSGLAAGDFVADGAIMSRLAATLVAVDAVAEVPSTVVSF